MPFFTPIRTLDELKRVVKLGSTTESIHLEFKQLYDRKPKDPKKEPKLEAARDIAQFANLDGGVILVGVSEIGDSGRPKVASEFEARVQNGRLVLDAPTDLPEGKVVALQTLDDDGLTDEERDEVLQAVDEGLADVKAGRTKPLSEILSRLRAPSRADVIFEFSDRAEADIEEISKWWSKHRDVGAGHFFEELEEAEKALLANPESGSPWRRRGGELVPRWLLEVTHYHVYYVYRPDDNQLYVLTVRGTKRLEPKL